MTKVVLTQKYFIWRRCYGEKTSFMVEEKPHHRFDHRGIPVPFTKKRAVAIVRAFRKDQRPNSGELWGYSPI